MSAHETWHEDPPQHNGEPILPQPHLRWTRATEIPRNSVPPQPPPSPADPLPEPPPDNALETDDIVARLLRAIEGTEIARRLGQPPTPVVRRAAPNFAPRSSTLLVQAPSSAESAPLMPSPTKSSPRPAPREETRPLPIAATRTVPPLPAMWRIAAVKPSSTLLVQAPSQAASRPLMPPAASSRRPLSAASSNPAQAFPIPLPLPFPSPPPPAAALKTAPALAPLTPAPSPDAISLSAPIPPSRGDELRRLAAEAALIASRISQAVAQLSTALWNWLVANAPVARDHAARAGARLSLELSNWLRNQAVPIAARAARTGIRLFIASKNALVHLAAHTGKRTAHACTQLSTALSKRMAPKPAPTPKPAARPVKRASTRSRSLFDPRRSTRLEQPPLVAWCWAADTPGALRIADISAGGIHLLTDVRWPRGATVPMTLQRTDRPKHAPGSWIVADFRILRWCQDGLAGILIPPTPYSVASGTENCADPATLKRFVKQLAVPARR
jgi:hypothetical protein